MSGMFVKPWMIGVFVGGVVGSSLLIGLLVSLVIPDQCGTSRQMKSYSESFEFNNFLKENSEKIEHSPPLNMINDMKMRGKRDASGSRNSPIYDICPELNEFQNNSFWESPRLTPNVYPTHYDLEIETNLTNAFDGHVTIHVELKEDTNVFVLHSRLEVLLGLNMVDKDGNEVQIKCDGYYPLNEYFVFITKNMVNKDNGPFKISILFIARADLFESGLFDVSYFGGSRDRLLTSHFEPLDARKAFPCFDEPSFKATFSLTIHHPVGTAALSNAAPISPDQPDPDENGYIVTVFNKTEALPTYLIGLTVFSRDDFKFVERFSPDKEITVRLWARTEYIESGLMKDLEDLVIDIFSAFEYLFGEVPEGIPSKIDIVALPEYPDDCVGHFGLVLCRETKILFNDTTTTESNKQEIALLIAKQFAQFWFGNLVTFKWWDELWLQEGITDYLKYIAVDEAYEQWRIREQFITEEMVDVLVKDGYPSSHPVIKKIDGPYDIEQLFDDVETSKVAAILRMVDDVEGAVMPSLILFAKQFKYGNGDPNYLWDSIGNIRKWPAKDFFDRWFRQSNYPTVFVDLRFNETTNTNYVVIDHDRFTNSEESVFALDELYPSPYNWVWYIPIKCSFGRNSTDLNIHVEEFDVDTREAVFYLNNPGDRYEWIHCDDNFMGYFTLQYTTENWENLAKALAEFPYNEKPFTPTDRANIIHNIFVNAFTERERYQELVNVLKYLRRETDLIPWRTAEKHIRMMTDILQFRGEAFFEVSKFFDFTLSNLEEDFIFGAWEPAGEHVEELLKTTVLELSCRLQHRSCLDKASEYWEKDKNTLPVHIRPIVYNYHFQNTYSVREWNQLYAQYVNTNDVQEQERFLRALTFTRLPSLLTRILEGDLIKEIDFFDLIYYLSKQPLGRQVAWDYYRNNYKQLVEEYSVDDPDLGQALIDIAYTFEDEFMFYELLRFIIYNEAGASQNNRFKALEIASTNFVWLSDKEEEIIRAFSGGRGAKVDVKRDTNEKNERLKTFKAKAREMFEEYKKVHNLKLTPHVSY